VLLKLLNQLGNVVAAPFHKQTLMEVGNEYYVDESFTLTTIPSGFGLNSGIWIMTANSDSSNTSANYLSFDVDRNVTVFVAYDSVATTLPNWLSSFSNTGAQIQVSQSGASFKVYCSSLTPDTCDSLPSGTVTVTLGGNLASPAAGAQNNYVVIVVPQ